MRKPSKYKIEKIVKKYKSIIGNKNNFIFLINIFSDKGNIKINKIIKGLLVLPVVKE